HQGLVVVGRARHRFFEDGRVGRDPRDALVPQPAQLAGSDQLAPDVVEPETLADLLKLFDGTRAAHAGGHVSPYFCSSLRAAAAIWRGAMPAALSSSSGLPEPGSLRTAQWASRG